MKSKIVFLGDSLTHGGRWNEYFHHQEIANFGIPGEKSGDILFRLDEVIAWEPDKIFLMMGINDLGNGLSFETILQNHEKLIRKLKNFDKTDLIIQSLLPINEGMFSNSDFGKNDILETNFHLKKLCEKEKITFVDLYSAFSTYHNQLIKNYTNDGLHVNEAGYRVWKNCLQSEKLI